MSVYLFCEGQTEKNIVEKFADLANPKSKGQGKAQVNNQMAETLEPFLNQPKPIRVLVMRDVDEGETPERIVQSVTGTVQEMLNQRGFPVSVQLQPHTTYPNVHWLALANPDLHLALHLSTFKWQEGFTNATIDDYVLVLALRETTAAALLRKKQWQTSPEQIIRKVTDRIPALLQENGIPVREAKDYVRLYAAVIQEHTSPATFASKVVANAADGDKQDIFAPLLAALNFLGAEKK